MGPAVTVQWVAPPDGRAPSTQARHSLEEWAEARGVRLSEARSAPLPSIVPDLAIADAVEDALEHARDSIAALDATGADRSLAKAEGLLHAHPELPQAAWLLAEVLRAKSVRWQRLPPHDAARGANAWERARRLDGGRAPGVGEDLGAGVVVNRAASVPVRLAFDLAVDTEDVETTLDGVPVHDGALVTSEGDHQLTVMRDGAIVWAAWVTVKKDVAIHIALPEPAPCSHEDLGRARASRGTRTVAARGVLCSDWVFAEEAAAGSGELLVASCEGDFCGAQYQWKVGPIGPVLSPIHESRGHWPAWATWTLVGASALAITGVTLAATGAFRPTHDEPVFTTGGVHIAAAPMLIHLGE